MGVFFGGRSERQQGGENGRVSSAEIRAEDRRPAAGRDQAPGGGGVHAEGERTAEEDLPRHGRAMSKKGAVPFLPIHRARTAPVEGNAGDSSRADLFDERVRNEVQSPKPPRIEVLQVRDLVRADRGALVRFEPREQRIGEHHRRAAEGYRAFQSQRTTASSTEAAQSSVPALPAMTGAQASRIQKPETATSVRIVNDRYRARLHVSSYNARRSG